MGPGKILYSVASILDEMVLAQLRGSADILVRSKRERADIRRKFQSCGADERCCGQECPRSGLLASAALRTAPYPCCFYGVLWFLTVSY